MRADSSLRSEYGNIIRVDGSGRVEGFQIRLKCGADLLRKDIRDSIQSKFFAHESNQPPYLGPHVRPSTSPKPRVAANRPTLLDLRGTSQPTSLRPETGRQARGLEYPVPYPRSGTPLIRAACMRRDQWGLFRVRVPLSAFGSVDDLHIPAAAWQLRGTCIPYSRISADPPFHSIGKPK
jgi:hypothetical protein